jgi:hypothetical protein
LETEVVSKPDQCAGTNLVEEAAGNLMMWQWILRILGAFSRDAQTCLCCQGASESGQRRRGQTVHQERIGEGCKQARTNERRDPAVDGHDKRVRLPVTTWQTTKTDRLSYITDRMGAWLRRR